MATKKLSKQTAKLTVPPSIIQTYSIVGPKEGEGPLGRYFDYVLEDEAWGEKTWEKSESKMLRECIDRLIKNSAVPPKDIDYVLAGDLLNQCISSHYALRDLGISFLGLYGACSTMSESLCLGSLLLDGGFADYLICATSSHYCSAERQFRFPLELGTQRAPTSQWTVTGTGSVLLCANGQGPYVTYVTTGKIIDKGIKDANNMGAAMAPAAADTIYQHFLATKESVDEYDLIITGDLGYFGMELCCDILKKMNLDITNKLTDCGVMIFEKGKQDIHSGGSGCGCSASVLSGYLYKQISAGSLKKILFVSTGALMSPTIVQQGESIPSIAHAVTIQKNLE